MFFCFNFLSPSCSCEYGGYFGEISLKHVIDYEADGNLKYWNENPEEWQHCFGKDGGYEHIAYFLHIAHHVDGVHGIDEKRAGG